MEIFSHQDNPDVRTSNSSETGSSSSSSSDESSERDAESAVDPRAVAVRPPRALQRIREIPAVLDNDFSGESIEYESDSTDSTISGAWSEGHLSVPGGANTPPPQANARDRLDQLRTRFEPSDYATGTRRPSAFDLQLSASIAAHRRSLNQVEPDNHLGDNDISALSANASLDSDSVGFAPPPAPDAIEQMWDVQNFLLLDDSSASRVIQSGPSVEPDVQRSVTGSEAAGAPPPPRPTIRDGENAARGAPPPPPRPSDTYEREQRLHRQESEYTRRLHRDMARHQASMDRRMDRAESEYFARGAQRSEAQQDAELLANLEEARRLHRERSDRLRVEALAAREEREREDRERESENRQQQINAVRESREQVGWGWMDLGGVPTAPMDHIANSSRNSSINDVQTPFRIGQVGEDAAHVLDTTPRTPQFSPPTRDGAIGDNITPRVRPRRTERVFDDFGTELPTIDDPGWRPRLPTSQRAILIEVPLRARMILIETNATRLQRLAARDSRIRDDLIATETMTQEEVDVEEKFP